MNKHYIDLRVYTTDGLRTLKELYRLSIDIEKVSYFKDYIRIKIEYKYYKMISKYYKCKIIKHYNIYGLTEEISKNKYYLFSLVLLFTFIFIISNIIIDIKIITSNEEMKNLITYELNKHELKKYTLKKDYDKLTSIKDDILKNNKENIEWIEIESIGMSYVVKVEDRIINNIEKENRYCNLIATKDGVIKRFNISKGDALINLNDYVKENDILVSGSINFNEENKANVCASGYVYANTWYNMNIKVNKKYKETNRIGKKRYNLKIKNKDNDYLIFKNRLENFESEDKRLLKIFNTSLYLTTDYEIESVNKEYTEDEINTLIDQEIERKFKNLLKDDYTIVSKKVLKKDIKDSMIDIDIFIVVEENIAQVQEYEIME